MSIPNNFYEIHQPKIAVALKVLGLKKYMKAVRYIRNKYDLDRDMSKYEEHIILEMLQKLREEL